MKRKNCLVQVVADCSDERNYSLTKIRPAFLQGKNSKRTFFMTLVEDTITRDMLFGYYRGLDLILAFPGCTVEKLARCLAIILQDGYY